MISVTWSEKYQTQRANYWAAVDSYFADLPPQLFQQAALLKNNLATLYSDTGQFKDILCRPHDHPLLYLHFWLLDDVKMPHNSLRVELEKHLFLAATFSFAAVMTNDTILNHGSNFDHQFLFLEQSLSRRANWHLAHLKLDPSFWQLQQQIWHEYSEASLALKALNAQNWSAGFDWRLAAHRLACSKVSLAAAATKIKRIDLLPQLLEMFDQINFVLQLLQDISTIRSDLLHRRFTLPIIATLADAEIGARQPFNPEQVLGALVLTNSIEKLGDDCLLRLEQAQKISTSLHLPSFSAYVEQIPDRLEALVALFSIKAKPNRPHSASKTLAPPRRTTFAAAVETLPKVIEMAEGYLLADLSFRESWEVQRRGVFGIPEMTGQAFPSGLIIEALCLNGHRLAEVVDQLFQTLHETGCRYYDHDHLPPDIDDLGLLLRLLPYSAQPGNHHVWLREFLGLLEKNFQTYGHFPVWLKQQPNSEMIKPLSVSLWGNRCATVEANLLLGLIQYDWKSWQQHIEKSAANIADRILAKGLSATWHYIPLYSIWTLFELMSLLAAKPISDGLRDKLNAARGTLLQRLNIEARPYRLTPQGAAFLMLSCLVADDIPEIRSLFRSDWLDPLFKQQRYDGAWPAEALFGTPTRGELASWYASRGVTTAFCYRALKRYQQATNRGHFSWP